VGIVDWGGKVGKSVRGLVTVGSGVTGRRVGLYVGTRDEGEVVGTDVSILGGTDGEVVGLMYWQPEDLSSTSIAPS